jgi:hypothetical protein
MTLLLALAWKLLFRLNDVRQTDPESDQGVYDLVFTLLLAQPLNPSAAPTLALVHAALLALGDKPAAAAQIFQNAAIHDFFVKATQQTVKGLPFTQSNRHGSSSPFYVGI